MIRPFHHLPGLCHAAVLCCLPLHAETASVTLEPPAEARPAPVEGGTPRNPAGETITLDSRSFFLNGRPWIPVAGEFHYSRFPRAEWASELRKMKAGGINTVSTYVFWIHHEEHRGTYNWSGDRDLRGFLIQCRDIGLKVIVRLGPWCHGEVRNGGFPDWVGKEFGKRARSEDPAFLASVESLFREEMKQMQGLLWKDGGPVIAVQLDNECRNGRYLLALKALARACGIDVPFYTVTGWQGGVPSSGLLPLFGGYPDGFWGGTPESYRKEYLFTRARVENDLGAQLAPGVKREPGPTDRFPYACAEIGPGMMSSDRKRIRIAPADAAALALAKLGCGNNLPGYYMYQGGINPDAGSSTLQEEHPNRMPIKDYDFQTALGACGEIRPQFHLLRMQHLFLAGFGPALARTSVNLPEGNPQSPNDKSALRWSVRADAAGAGFLFFNNHQPGDPLPARSAQRFRIVSAAGTIELPATPVDIPSGSYGIWPLHLDCGGVMLDYATAQPLCRLRTGPDHEMFFFSGIDGIRAELAIHGRAPVTVTPGLGAAATARTPGGQTIDWVVLPAALGRTLQLCPVNGRMHAVLCASAVIETSRPGELLVCDAAPDTRLAICPPLPTLCVEGKPVTTSRDGVFATLPVGPASAGDDPPAIDLPHPASPASGPPARDAYDEDAWKRAAVHPLPLTAAHHDCLMSIRYIGNAARLELDGRLIDDHFANGDPLDIALWRIPAKDLPRLTLRVLPFRESNSIHMPGEFLEAARDAVRSGTAGRVTCTFHIIRNISLTPSGKP